MNKIPIRRWELYWVITWVMITMLTAPFTLTGNLGFTLLTEITMVTTMYPLIRRVIYLTGGHPEYI